MQVLLAPFNKDWKGVSDALQELSLVSSEPESGADADPGPSARPARVDNKDSDEDDGGNERVHRSTIC